MINVMIRLIGVAAVVSCSMVAQDAYSRLSIRIANGIRDVDKKLISTVSKMSTNKARIYLFQSEDVEKIVEKILNDSCEDVDAILLKHDMCEPELRVAFVRMAILYKIKHQNVSLAGVVKILKNETTKLRKNSPKPPAKPSHE